MKIRFLDPADEDFKALSPEIRRSFRKQLGYLAENLHHPSLRAKKYNEKKGVWQARVTRDWRFYFLIRADEYVILIIVPHPK